MFRLRPWRTQDAVWYLDARDEEILRWTTEPVELTVADFATGLAKLDGRSRAGFAIVDEDGDLVGNVAAVRTGTTADLSYWVASAARGRGAATFALVAMTQWVADNWPVSRLELQINPDNLASTVVAERAGYTNEGRRESCLSCAGSDGTVLIYAQEVSPVVS
ncbi:MAG: GNAT family protein [Acidimicrobiia bacterium]|nr:GNAT family protein [Acidimicrobiia bacterium]